MRFGGITFRSSPVAGLAAVAPHATGLVGRFSLFGPVGMISSCSDLVGGGQRSGVGDDHLLSFPAPTHVYGIRHLVPFLRCATAAETLPNAA